MTKKIWENQNLSNLLADETKEQDTCGEAEAKCICKYYHARILGGCEGCKTPGYKCKFTGCKPIFTKKCTFSGDATPPTAS